jgi:hypothetical protein
MRRRLLSLVLVLPLLEPLSFLAKGATAGDHECHDHVCMCARRCPPRRSLERPCHGSAEEPQQVRGACSHDQVGALGSVKIAVLTATSFLAALPALDLAPPLVGSSLPSGHTRIDPLPPRAL